MLKWLCHAGHITLYAPGLYNRLGMVYMYVYIKGSQVIISTYTLYFLSLKIVFVLENSVDPYWVFTVCQSTHLKITGI